MQDSILSIVCSAYRRFWAYKHLPINHPSIQPIELLGASCNRISVIQTVPFRSRKLEMLLYDSCPSWATQRNLTSQLSPLNSGKRFLTLCSDERFPGTYSRLTSANRSNTNNSVALALIWLDYLGDPTVSETLIHSQNAVTRAGGESAQFS